MAGKSAGKSAARSAGKSAAGKSAVSDTLLPPQSEDAADPQADASPDAAPETARAGKPRGKRAGRQSAYPAFPYIAGALAVALLAIGVASYFAASLLGGAVRASARRGAETPTALATTICDDLIHQNYSDLVARVDPAPAPPSVTGAFDANTTTQRLQALDRAGGPVTSCAASPLSASDVDPASSQDGATRLLLTMWRAGTPQPIAAVLITRQAPDSAWVIERDSSFLLAS